MLTNCILDIKIEEINLPILSRTFAHYSLRWQAPDSVPVKLECTQPSMMEASSRASQLTNCPFQQRERNNKKYK
jgi:hypothetical protein